MGIDVESGVKRSPVSCKSLYIQLRPFLYASPAVKFVAIFLVALPEISARRWLQIEDELERTGTYWQSAEELEYGPKVAWRNSTRCIGRLHWQNLVVRDCRALRSAEEIFSALIEHVRLSTGTGKVVPMITIFAPEYSDQRPVRIWNRQLIGYAGHRQSDGSIVGDP